jgi:hypothetical protein
MLCPKASTSSEMLIFSNMLLAQFDKYNSPKQLCYVNFDFVKAFSIQCRIKMMK